MGPAGLRNQGDSESVTEERQTDEQRERDDDAPAVDGGDETPEDLEAALDEARRKADDYWDQLLHARADLTNMQRRAERELANAHKYALDRFVRELLPVHDSLELGLKAASEPDSDPEKIREGIELTLRMLIEVLDKFGVKVVDPQGEPFDPALHEAMTTQPAPDLPPNTVVNVFQKGFVLNDRLVRPASVVVSAGGGKDDEGGHPRIDEHA